VVHPFNEIQLTSNEEQAIDKWYVYLYKRTFEIAASCQAKKKKSHPQRLHFGSIGI
jgi:hypothetical protein